MLTLSFEVVLLTRWVVLEGLLERIHGNFSSRGQEGYAAAHHCIASDVVVLIKAASCLYDRQALVARVEHHLCMTCELST